MAKTWNQRRLDVETQADKRLIGELGAMARQVAGVVTRYAVPQNTSRVIPNNRATRTSISRDVWGSVVKPYFIGAGNDALVGAEAQSPYARGMVDGIRAGITVQAERQVSIIQRYAPDDVRDWLITPPSNSPRNRGEDTRLAEMDDRQQGYDPFHLFVYGNSPYKLSDRVWLTAVDVRARIDALLDYHIPRGTAAVDIADYLVDFLTPGAARQITRKPYGVEGSYAARRLSRTEITAAAGRAVVNMSMVNPFVQRIRWRLSPSHPKVDICDNHAAGGPDGDGTYPPESVPLYPAHPHCLCSLVPDVVARPGEVVADLRAQIEARTPEAMRLRGAFNLDWLVPALLFGWFVYDVVRD